MRLGHKEWRDRNPEKMKARQAKEALTLTNDKLLCGTNTEGGLETRQKYIDLLIGLVTNFPGYKAPEIPKAS